MTPVVVILGLMLGLGMCLVWAWADALRPRLADRIAPYVRGSVADEVYASSAPLTPFPTVERLLAPVLRDGVQAVERWGASTAQLQARLLRAGGRITPEQYRVEQVLCAVAGVAVGVAVAVVLAATRGAGVLPLLVLVACLGVIGALARDYALGRAVARREARVTAELPTIAELLALSVSAGEGVHGALERLARLCHGAVAEDLRDLLAAARTGTPLVQALRDMGARSGVPAMRRFMEAIATAVERGTPLAEVLRAQAQDVRAEGRRALMEDGGKREIAMLVPVVFLILPVTVVFAVYPGLVAIRWGF